MKIINKKMSRRVFVDSFRASDSGVFFLTHVHSDHLSLPKSFANTIFTDTANVEVCSKMYPNHTFSSIPLLRYVIVQGVRVIMFATYHMPGSVGFFFPELSSLHVGDGRITDSLMVDLKSIGIPSSLTEIRFDNLFHDEKLGDFPSIAQSADILDKCMIDSDYSTFAVVCVHAGTILLMMLLGKSFCIDVSSQKMRNVMLVAQANCPWLLHAKASLVLCDKSQVKKYANRGIILPSARHFRCIGGVRSTCVVHENVHRIPFLCHATYRENIRLLTSFAPRKIIPLSKSDSFTDC